VLAAVAVPARAALQTSARETMIADLLDTRAWVRRGRPESCLV
jgi:hypothetical protein